MGEPDLKAAHDRLERELIRAMAAKEATRIVLKTDGQMTYPTTDGAYRVVSWSHLQSFGEGLRKRGIAEEVETANPAITITLTSEGRSMLMSTEFFVRVDTRRRKEEAAQSAKRAPRKKDNIPTAHAMMRAIIDFLHKHDGKKFGKILAGIAPVIRYPIDRVYAGWSVDGGALARKTFDQSMAALLRAGLVMKRGKGYRLSELGKVRRRSGRLSLPEIAPVKSSASVAPPKISSGNPPVGKGKMARMRDSELVSLWKNAIRIMSDPLKKSSHNAAKLTIANVTREWERRTAEMQVGSFPWPSTEAREGNGLLSLGAAQPEGMLAFMEYRVGRVQGEAEAVRRAILKRVFESTLPPAFPKAYMEEWGSNASADRLKKLAVSIAAFVRNNKRRRIGDYSDAIREWESDLEWLYKVYYIGRFKFAAGWPETAI